MSESHIVEGKLQQTTSKSNPEAKPNPEDSIQKAKSALNDLFAHRNSQNKLNEHENDHKEDVDKPFNKGESGSQIDTKANLGQSDINVDNKGISGNGSTDDGIKNSDVSQLDSNNRLDNNNNNEYLNVETSDKPGINDNRINNNINYNHDINQNSEEESPSMSALASPETETTKVNKPCMQLKGSLVPMTLLELNYFDSEQFKEDLRAKTLQAPEFFDNLPVVIGLEKFDESSSLPFGKLIEICKDFSIKAVAVRGGSELLQSSAKQAGLSIFAKQKEREQKERANEAESPAPVKETVREVEVIKEVEVEVVKTVVEKARQASKVVHHPVRSGQQVYAADGDLIVLASVSAGAEILADGNIHVYGTLRGRALAGVKGDTKARIFCQSMAAELVSIAGQYKISEDLDKSVLGKPAQAYLEDEALKFKVLEG